jgi:hypothetical protein
MDEGAVEEKRRGCVLADEADEGDEGNEGERGQDWFLSGQARTNRKTLSTTLFLLMFYTSYIGSTILSGRSWKNKQPSNQQEDRFSARQ